MKMKPPVFVLGCPRSGTTLLYHMLLSAGGFAIYRAETHVFNLLVPRFGNLNRAEARARLIDEWLTTEYFQRSGLDAAILRARVLADCRNGGDFLRILMESIAMKQGVERWAECTPEHLLHVDEIKRTIPDAKIIHIIRDGRDVALSLEKQGWIRPFPPDRKQSLLVAGLYWEWIVNKGRTVGARIAPDYMETRFEDLISNPHEAVVSIGRFIGQPLDYEQIARTGIGSVSQPNTSFATKASAEGFSPVGRWKDLSLSDLVRLEALLSPTLRAMGYELQTSEASRGQARVGSLKRRYHAWFTAKHWLKTRTPLGRFTNAALLYQPIGRESPVTGENRGPR